MDSWSVLKILKQYHLTTFNEILAMHMDIMEVRKFVYNKEFNQLKKFKEKRKWCKMEFDRRLSINEFGRDRWI